MSFVSVVDQIFKLNVALRLQFVKEWLIWIGSWGITLN